VGLSAGVSIVRSALSPATGGINKRRAHGRGVIFRATAEPSPPSGAVYSFAVKRPCLSPDILKVIAEYQVCPRRTPPRSMPIVSHSTLALQHLINKIDTARPWPKRVAAPVWLPEFVDQVAELFEPFVDVGRVGYECAPNTERWELSMFLGSTEVVG